MCLVSQLLAEPSYCLGLFSSVIYRLNLERDDSLLLYLGCLGLALVTHVGDHHISLSCLPLLSLWLGGVLSYAALELARYCFVSFSVGLGPARSSSSSLRQLPGRPWSWLQ